MWKVVKKDKKKEKKLKGELCWDDVFGDVSCLFLSLQMSNSSVDATRRQFYERRTSLSFVSLFVYADFSLCLDALGQVN